MKIVPKEANASSFACHQATAQTLPGLQPRIRVERSEIAHFPLKNTDTLTSNKTTAGSRQMCSAFTQEHCGAILTD